MFWYYNIVWIICLILFFIMLFVLLRKRRTRNNLATGNATTDANFVIIDMNGRPTQQANRPATYDPPPPTAVPSTFTTYRPSSSDLEPPPPSYQDYSKDHRVPNV